MPLTGDDCITIKVFQTTGTVSCEKDQLEHKVHNPMLKWQVEGRKSLFATHALDTNQQAITNETVESRVDEGGQQPQIQSCKSNPVWQPVACCKCVWVCSNPTLNWWSTPFLPKIPFLLRLPPLTEKEGKQKAFSACHWIKCFPLWCYMSVSADG